MKKAKLILDKLNVVRLNTTRNILGGRGGEPTGVDVPYSTHCPDEPENANTKVDLTNMQSILTGRTSARSSRRCMGG